MMMQRYPYLAKYKASTQYDGIVLFMVEPHRGYVLYVPTASAPDARAEINIMDQMLPSNSDIDDYAGSVTLRTSANPTLGA